MSLRVRRRMNAPPVRPCALRLTAGEYQTASMLSDNYQTLEEIVRRGVPDEDDTYDSPVVTLRFTETDAWTIRDAFEADGENAGSMGRGFYRKLYDFIESIV